MSPVLMFGELEFTKVLQQPDLDPEGTFLARLWNDSADSPGLSSQNQWNRKTVLCYLLGS